MNILDTHNYKLRFKLDFDAPDKYIEKWNKIKEESETTDNEYLVEEIKNNCKLESNKDFDTYMSAFPNYKYAEKNSEGDVISKTFKVAEWFKMHHNYFFSAYMVLQILF